MNKILERSSYALAAAGLLLPSFAIGTPVYAGGGCVSATSFATEGYVANAEELELAITDSAISSVKLSNDFAVTCSLSFITKDFTLDLNGKTLTAGAWSIDMEGTSGKTLTIADSAGTGKYVLDSVGKGIWVEGGNTLVISGGTISNTAGQGRAAVVLGGDFRMTGGAINMQNDQQTDSGTGKTFYMPAVVLSDSSATITGGDIKGSYTGIEASGEKDLTVSGGKIEGGDTAISLSEGTLKFEGGALASSDSYVVALFSGATFNMSDGTLTAGDAFALSGNFNAGPIYANISGGTLTSGADYAIYMPGDPEAKSTITISGDPIIKGAGGAIGINGGNLVIEGGSFESEGKIGTREGSLGNGSYGFHDAVLGLPSAYTDTNVTISGGTFTAKGEAELIWTSDVCKDPGHTGTTCELGLIISGGAFSVEPDTTYITEGKKARKIGDAYVVSGEVEVDAETDDDMDEADDQKAVENYATKQLEALVDKGVEANERGYYIDENFNIEVSQLQAALVAGVQLNSRYNQSSYEDWDDELSGAEIATNFIKNLEEIAPDAYEEIMNLLGENGTVAGGFEGEVVISADGIGYIGNITKLDKEITITYQLPKDAQAVPEGYERTFYIIRLHFSDADGKWHITKLDTSKDGDTLTTKSKEFSSFIVAYEDVKTAESEEESETDTREEEKNPNTFDRGITTFLVIGGITTPVLLAGAWILAKRNS